MDKFESLQEKLSEAFNAYIKKVDAFYKDCTSGCEALFVDDNSVNPDSPDLFFYRAIYYVIRKFLESSNDSDDELFIKVPVDEIALKPNRQDVNFQKMQDAICHSLAMAVYPQEGIEAASLSDENLGEIYYTSESIECDEGENRPRLWEVKKGEINGIYPQELYPDTKGNRQLSLGKVPKRQQIFQEHLQNTYKLACKPGNNNSATRNKLAEMARLLQFYKANQPVVRYKNALLVGYGSTNSSLRICDIPYMSYPLTFEKRYLNVAQKHYDIIVFAGDAKYNGLEGEMNNVLAKGYTRKVIYIGSEAPNNYRGQEFSFSNRELYHYFANDQFPKFKVHKLPWEELTNLVNKLNEILSKESLRFDEEIIKRTITYTIAPYVGYSPFKKVEPLDERLLDFLNDNFPISDEQWQLLDEAVRGNLNVPSHENPKKKEYEIIKKNSVANKCLLLEAYSSYSNKIRKACTGKGNTLWNSYVVDVCSDSNCYVEVVKCLFKRLALGTIHLLSYSNLDKIKAYLRDEYKCYNASYRKSILNNIEYVEVSDDEPQSYGSLDSFEFSLLDDLITSYGERNIDTSYYTLTSEGNDQYDVRGELIRNNQKIKAYDLYENSEDLLPSEISFYVTPECFQRLRDILYDFPQGKDIKTYEKLWKQKLHSRCENEYAGDYKSMWKEDNFKFIELRTFRSYANGLYQQMFPNLFSRLASRMKALGLLTNEELEYSLKAQAASKKSRPLGAEIKQGVYEYMLTGKCNVAVVNNICRNSQKQRWAESYTLEDIKQLCIISTKIMTITKSTNEHNDDE